MSVILPAHDEAAYLPACVDALLVSGISGVAPQLIVVANGCTDDTAAVAQSYECRAKDAGWRLKVIDTPEGGKLNALQLGDAATEDRVRIYLDADVTVSPGLLKELVNALDTEVPRYASGVPHLQRARSAVSRAYGRFWMTVPFMTHDVPGFGVFAMNAAGRNRWGPWPDIISDDTFARLNFAPDERVLVGARYTWPLVEGFANLVRVRRRQNAGVAQVQALFPALMKNDGKPPASLGSIALGALRDPIGFAAYSTVALAVRLPIFRATSYWVRGR